MPRRSHTLLLTAALLACAAPPLSAQRGLQLGVTVRVLGLDVPGTMVEGLYAGTYNDTVRIGVTGGIEAIRIPRRAITHLQVKFGRRSGAMRSSMLGMAAGTGAGAIAALAFRNQLRSSEAPGLILGAGAVGALIGGAAGQFIFRADRWIESPLDLLDEEPRLR